ncbi:phosphoenolpyruvate--protein phosphotransferase [Gammaproteobacteria bacterium]|nr:phosphoenolpyruvate--protein phosphotransferase [Gammaproteobacteria bacterium]
MSILLKGLSVSKGICIGKAILINKDGINYVPSFIKKSQTKSEVNKFAKSLSNIKKEYKKSRDKIKDNPSITKLMETQLFFVEDKDFQKHVINNIENNLYTANWAIATEYRNIKKSFDDIKDKYIKERLIDIKQMVISLLDLLQSNKKENVFSKVNLENRFIVTDEITPKDIIDIYQNKGLGVITSHGSTSSHSAILSKSLSLPMMIKVQSSKEIIQDNDIIVMDSDDEIIVVNPDQFELEYFKNLQSKKNSLQEDLRKVLKKKSLTNDGTKINIMSNLELSDEVDFLNNNCDGIGLFRTEYLYMNRKDLPSEKEQISVYKKIFKTMGNKPVTLRTLDIGSDKEVSENIKVGEIAKNPALGLRGIRYSLNEKNIFKTQIKAMLRAGYNNSLRILIPMITSLSEIIKTKELIDDVKLQLKKERKNFTDKYDLGIMIEVPACALQSDELANHVDFMSIGTNDLIQYTLAIDRIDDEVSSLYDPTNPAVLTLIKKVIESANKSKIDVTVCGEMAGEKSYTKLLLGLGLKSFSMHPQAIPEVKNIILNSHINKIKRKVNAILKSNNRSKRQKLISNL